MCKASPSSPKTEPSKKSFKSKLPLPKPVDIIAFVIFLGLGIFLTVKPTFRRGDKIVVQTQDSAYEYPLSKNAVYQFKGPLGITKVQVQDGKVRITDSPCPNKICINQGWGTTLICLPNNVIVTVLKENGTKGTDPSRTKTAPATGASASEENLTNGDRPLGDFDAIAE